MRKSIFMTVLAVLIPFLVFSSAEAKRGPAPKAEPLVCKGVKFIAPNTPQKMGYVEAWDIETNKKIWEKKVYTVFINPILEPDVQWVFISSLKIDDGKLIVSDERGKEYKVDIPKNMLKEDIQPLQFTIKSDKEVYEVGEEIGIELVMKNNSDKEIVLFWDKKAPIWHLIPIDYSDGSAGLLGETFLISNENDIETVYIKPNQLIRKEVSINTTNFGHGTYRLQFRYNPPNTPLNFETSPNQKLFINAFTSNDITIKVTEKKGVSKDIPSQRSSKIIKRSVGQGDYVRDERNPAEACNLLIQEVRDSNPGMDCKLINSGRVDSPENFAECVDGATVAGCFTCIFECK